MSRTHPAGPSSPNFQLILSSALKAYEKQTKNDLITHPLAAQLQACQSPSSILVILQQQVQGLNRSRASDDRLTKWLDPTVNVLHAFSKTLGEGVSLVFSPATAIFTGIGFLLSAARDVRASQETLIDIFERIGHFFGRLEVYTYVLPTTHMMEIIVRIMVEVFSILGTATKEIKQGRTKKYLKRLAGRTDMEDALRRLDKLTHNEGMMAAAQILRATHAVDREVSVVADGALDVDDRVASGGDEVKAVGDNVSVVIDDGREAKVVRRQTADDVGHMKRNQLRQDLLRWLSPPDPSTNHNIACNARHEGTADWFFEGSIFREWKSAGSLLWVHGKPGSGKSVLCSTIIKHVISLRNSGLASMAYFYYDFRDKSKQNCRGLFSSLVIQLSARSDSYCDILFRLYLAHDGGAQKPSEDDLMKCLKEMVALPDHPPVYLIIDALDECPDSSGMPSSREQVLYLFKELVGLSLPNLYLCVTSRSEVDIRTALEPLTSCRVSLHNQSGHKKDITVYVTSVVQSDPKMRRWREQDRRLVIETLTQRADGMFRWVFCQLETLRHCLPPSVRRMLDELPKTLDETYERVLGEINVTKRAHAHRLLQCLTVAVRPLRVAELAEVLAVDIRTEGTPKLNLEWRLEDQEEAVVSACSSLVIIVKDGNSRIVQFSHLSVKEFLTSSPITTLGQDIPHYRIDSASSHLTMAQTCLGVLLRLDSSNDKASIKDLPLAEYAAQHWTDHAGIDGVFSQVQDGVDRFLDANYPNFAAWYQLTRSDRFRKTVTHLTPLEVEVAPLRHISELGFLGLARYLIFRRPQDVHAGTRLYDTPLHAPLHEGHVQACRLLCQDSGDVDVRDLQGRTTLHFAASSGQLQVLQMLIERGADINARDNADETPLYETLEYINYKSADRYFDVMQVLLEHGADVDAQNNAQWTPLHRASYYGSLRATRVLLEHNANVQLRNNKARTALHYARQPDVVQLLLDQGVDADIQDDDGATTLHVASSEGKLEVAQLLLKHGANINVRNKSGQTPFEVALAGGHQGIMQILSEHMENGREM